MVALSHPVTSRVLANLLAFVSEQDLDLEEEEVVDTLVQVTVDLLFQVKSLVKG